ncbi:hypothetical protein D8674_006838 [Pyrus ussuriensis x Pyrus communis]|uniref:Disease resistance N-terminal domain-containing protein n=1 Tax=Pyrus ussuriensis x Pyrus communis TaxID=2448454 RepID=A0A5N5FZX5_9ROSA|nr:hypothetical protein D8674_006838 [Pyrus ussuriensis x Pyrus communis]
MAGALIGEAFLSASIEVLCDRIASTEFVDLFRQNKLDELLLEKLKVTLPALSAVLNDAEEKQISNRAVRKWLDDSSMLSSTRRTYLMRSTLKLCDARWKRRLKVTLMSWYHDHYFKKQGSMVSQCMIFLTTWVSSCLGDFFLGWKRGNHKKLKDFVICHMLGEKLTLLKNLSL